MKRVFFHAPDFIYLLDVRANRWTSGTEVDPLFGSADTGGF